MLEHFSGRGALFRRALQFTAAAAVLGAALFALAAPAPADAQTTSVNADATVWVQRLDDETGEPIDLTRGYWRWAFANRFETRDVETLKARVYLLKEARDGDGTAPSPSDYATYGDFDAIWLTLKNSSAGSIFDNPLSTASLQNKDGSAELTTGDSWRKSLSPAVWHQNTAGYVSGAAAPSATDRVQPIDITIDFGSGGLNRNNFFLWARKNCGGTCSGGNRVDKTYEWKLPHRVEGLGWGMFARLNGATPPEPVLNADGQAAWDDMHYLNQSADTTLTVRFYFKKTDPDNLNLRASKPSDPDATYADYFEHSARIYQVDSAVRGNMPNVRFYNVGTTDRWAGCRSGGSVNECYINDASLRAAATAAGASASDMEDSDEVIPVDFDVFIPIGDVGNHPGVNFFSRGGAIGNLESGGARWPHGLGQIKRPALNLNLRRNTYDRGASTCTHDYPIATTVGNETAEQLARIAADESGGSLAHNCDDLSVAPGQSVFIGFWAGFARPGVHPQEYDWNRNDKHRIYGYRSNYGMRIREFDRITVTTGGNGTFGIGTRCPEHSYLDAPQDRFYDEEWPKPRTREGMGTCTSTSIAWSGGNAERAAGDRYTGPAGLGHFTPYPDVSGTVSLNATAYGTDRDGDGDPDWTATAAPLVITIDSTKTVVSASDTFVDGQTDDSPLAAYVSRSDYNGMISLKVGRLERHAFPIFPKKPADREGGQPFASVAELTGAGELEWQEGRTRFGETKFGEEGESRGEVLDGHYLGPVLFSNLAEEEAVRVTVDRGVVSHEGEACTASEGGCTLSLSRAELMTSRGRGASGEVGTAANDPFVISYLDYAPAGTGQVTFTVQAFPAADSNWTAADPTTYTETVPTLDPLSVRAVLLDADGVLDPGDVTGVTVGVESGGPTSAAGNALLLNLVVGDGIYESAIVNSQGGLSGYANTAGSGVLHDFSSDSYLVITGPATWPENGGKRLAIGSGSTFSKLTCISTNDLDSGIADEDAATCYVVDANGARPELAVDSDAANGSEITVSGSFTAGLDGFTMAHWPADLDLGPRAYRLAAEAFGSATFSVKDIQQLSSISFGRKPATDGNVPTGPIRINGSDGIRLALLNEDGRATRLDAVSAITVTVIGGGTLTGLGCEALSSCTFAADEGPLFDAAEADPAKTAQIDLTFNAPKDPGRATIEATVVGIDGMTFAERLVLTVSGSAAEIASSGEMPRVHSSATTDDDRDEIKIAISATDADGNAARMPANAAATVRGIDGAIVSAGRLTSQVSCTDEGRLKCNLEITVTAPAGTPLASGAYTATVTGSGIGSTEVGFAVGGPAEKISLAVPATADLPGLAASFTATARVLDKEDVPVADGTWVTFDTTAASGGAESAIVTRPALADHDNDTTTDAVRRAQTKNGEAGATVTIVANGIAILTATVDGKSANEPIDTRAETTAAAAAAADDAEPPVRFGTADGAAATGSLATWASNEQGDARQALEQVPGATIVWLWNGVAWIRWGMTEDGTRIPGSTSSPFVVLQGDRIWFAN